MEKFYESSDFEEHFKNLIAEYKKMRMLSETKQKLLNAKSNTHLALTANKKVNIPTYEFVDNVKPIFAFMF